MEHLPGGGKPLQGPPTAVPVISDQSLYSCWTPQKDKVLVNWCDDRYDECVHLNHAQIWVFQAFWDVNTLNTQSPEKQADWMYPSNVYTREKGFHKEGLNRGSVMRADSHE